MDKASMSSDRSFMISAAGDDVLDTASISSFPKRNRLSQMTTQQQRNAAHGSASNIPEVDQLISKGGSSNTVDSTSQESADDGRLVDGAAQFHFFPSHILKFIKSHS